MNAGTGIDLARLADMLRIYPRFQDLDVDELVALPFTSAMHHHVRIGRRGWIARVPIGAPSLSHARAQGKAEAAAYQRLAPAGCTPRLRVALRPRPGAPLGVLVVQEIVGRPARVPDDMTAIARSLADVHRLESGAADAWPPIPVDRDPVRSRIATIRSHLAWLAGAPLDPDVRAAMIEELAWAMRFHADATAMPPAALALVDTHPGNFLIDASGRAIFIDLDNVLYGPRTADVAYASLPSSIRWALPDSPSLRPEEVLAFERTWLDALPPSIAALERSWVRPMRRLCWLRQIVWFARGWVHGEMADSLPDGETMRARARAMLTPDAIAAMRAEWLGPEALPPP